MEFPGNGLRNADGFVPQLFSGLGQRDHEIPLVALVPDLFDVALGFQLLQEGRYRVGLQEEGFAQKFLVDLLFLPQHHHDDVLRVGEVELVEGWLVFPGDHVRDGVQRKAQLVLQSQNVVFIFHGEYLAFG